MPRTSPGGHAPEATAPVNISAPFIRRPIATSLIATALLVLGIIARMIGLLPLSGVLSRMAGPRSRSCQSYVIGSPFGSLPIAVSTNGVPVGILNDAPASTVGGLLPVASDPPTPGIELVMKLRMKSMLSARKYGSLCACRSSPVMPA